MNIVLMHGILGFGEVIPPIPDYFHGVADHLRQTIPARVFLTAVAPAGTVIVRAQEAARQIDDALATGLLDRREQVRRPRPAAVGFAGKCRRRECHEAR